MLGLGQGGVPAGLKGACMQPTAVPSDASFQMPPKASWDLSLVTWLAAFIALAGQSLIYQVRPPSLDL